jgi:Alpha-galactosidase, CBM13 domain
MKKQINPSIKAHLLRSALILLSLLAICAIPFALAQSHGRGINNRSVANRTAQSQFSTKNINSPQQNIVFRATLQPSAATHETRAGLQEVIEFPSANEITQRVETVSSPPTRSSFMATWGSVSGAKGYFLDVSTSNSFSSYVDGYHDLNVGNVNGRAVTGLDPGTTYYYRVRPYTAAGSGGCSNVVTARTEAPTGLIINPTFDSSILNNPNSAVIQAMINRAIGVYELLFSDPITIQILFRYSDAPPSPEPSPSPFPPDVLSESRSVRYILPWNAFISALRADATTSNDNIANFSLPGSALSPFIQASSANGRAVGLDTPPAMLPDGTVGGGPYDGIVTLNSAQPFQFTRPTSSSAFDAQRATEHEMDEVMGFGSLVRSSPTPPCAWSAEAESGVLAGGATPLPCPSCSGGFRVGYVGNNSGTLQFNGVTANVTGSNVLTIWYTNGDAVRYAYLSVNGSPGVSVSFPSTGSFQTVGSIQTTITLTGGNNNTLEFYNPIVGNWAPDFDLIGVNCTSPQPGDLRPQDLFSWSSPGVRNLTLNGSRYFSINSGSTNIVNFNQTPPGDFGDWLSEACPQTHPYVQNAFICPGQSSDIAATSPEGINLDVIGYDLVNGPTPSLGNLSTRAFVQTGDNVMIGGFIVQGTGTKRVIIRAIGPELSQYGVPDPMQDPTLELHDSTGALIASNNDWQHTIIGGIITRDQAQDIQNSGHAPGNASESAIIADLPPDNYTAIVRGVNNTTGVALVEVYDLSPNTSSILGNISTRSFVQTGDNVMIGGFIVQGTQPKNVIIRAIGPELSQFDVPDPLADPTLELYNGIGALIASNNNWQTTIIGGIITQNQVQDIENSGRAPTDPRESAIIANLPPGNYTAIVRGVNNSTGVALVEVYDLH